jgi:hypothetical protein
MADRISYALEELLTAARVPHAVLRARTDEGWDLYYSDRPPNDAALWMAASQPAWRFFSQPGTPVMKTTAAVMAGEPLRLPHWEAVAGRLLADSPPIPPSRTGLPDVAAAAFFFLSRWEEWQAPERDGFGRFPLAASVFARGLWTLTECPVEAYARSLRRTLEAAPHTTWLARTEDYQANNLGINGQGAFAIGLSHDIDSLRCWDLRSFARSGRSAGRSLLLGRVGTTARIGVEMVGGVRARLMGQDPHQNLETIVALEQALCARATFFLLPRHTHRWDGTHPTHYQRLLPAQARMLAGVAEVGVHASTAATSAPELRTERLQLEQHAGVAIRGVRFHNLRGGYAALPDVAAAGFAYDSTLGFAEEPGFVAGIARPFRPYDRERDCPLDLVEIPLALMDATLRSPRYLGLEITAGRQCALAALERVRRCGGAAAVLWHNDNLPPNEADGYAPLYHELIDWTRAAGGQTCTLAEIAHDWTRTRKALRHG